MTGRGAPVPDASAADRLSAASAAEELGRYARAADVAPRPGLASDIMAAIGREPAPDPVAVVTASVRAGRLRGAAGGLRDAWRVAWSGRFPIGVRLSSAVAVLAVALALGGGGGLAGAAAWNAWVAPAPPAESETPTLSASPEPPGPSPTARPTPGPAATPPGPTATPAPTHHPEPTRGTAPAPTHHPEPTHGAGHG